MARNQFMSSSNPFMSESTFAKNSSDDTGWIQAERNVMTIQGAVNKSLILTAILLVSAVLSVKFLVTPAYLPYLSPMMYGSIIGGLVLVIASYWKPTIAQYTAPLYAVVEGVFVGIISGVLAERLGFGIVFNAVMLTVLCLGSMLVAYKFGIIKPTQKFRSIITTATMAIAMIYFVNIILSFFGMNLPYLHEGGMIGIGISIFIIGIATLNLILDFDNIERGARAGAPKYMEWVTSLGLLVTLVWIYIEILRLLAIFASND